LFCFDIAVCVVLVLFALAVEVAQGFLESIMRFFFCTYSPIFILGLFILFSKYQQSLTAKNLLLFIPRFSRFSLVVKVMRLEGGRLFSSPLTFTFAVSASAET